MIKSFISTPIPPSRLPACMDLKTDEKTDFGNAQLFHMAQGKNQPSKPEKTDRKTDKTAFLSNEVIGDKRKRARPSQGRPLKNPAIYSKTALAVYKRRRFHMELMTGFEPVTSSLPSCDESRASPVFRHYLLRTNSYIIITEWF